MNRTASATLLLSGLLAAACQHGKAPEQALAATPDSTHAVPTALPTETLKPLIVTEPVTYDTDDPAIWIDPADHSKEHTHRHR